MTRRPLRAAVPLLALPAVLGGAACTDITVDDGRRTAITLTADPVVAVVGQTVSFTFDAEGQSLAGVRLAYGDGAVDSVAAQGAQTASADLEHAYAAAADYRAIATVIELNGSRRADTVVISVSEGAGG